MRVNLESIVRGMGNVIRTNSVFVIKIGQASIALKKNVRIIVMIMDIVLMASVFAKMDTLEMSVYIKLVRRRVMIMEFVKMGNVFATQLILDMIVHLDNVLTYAVITVFVIFLISADA